MDKNKVVLKIEGLKKSFGDLQVLKKVDLEVHEGEVISIIGPSGTGKSTILRCINRMHDATEGQVLVDDVDVSTLKGAALRKFRRKVGMIFQSFNLVTRSTALKNVLSSMVPDMNFFRVLFVLRERRSQIAYS